VFPLCLRDPGQFFVKLFVVVFPVEGQGVALGVLLPLLLSQVGVGVVVAEEEGEENSAGMHSISSHSGKGSPICQGRARSPRARQGPAVISAFPYSISVAKLRTSVNQDGTC